MTRLIGISGSLRKGSFNTALLRSGVDVVPAKVKLSVHTVHGIPLYDGDVETESGIPQSVADLKDAIAAADGLILATPEYNNSVPGVLKNAVDWLSRPPADIKWVFGGKPVAVIGATPGNFGTILGQNAWLPVLQTLGTRPWFGSRLFVSRAQDIFDDDGHLHDEKIREQLQKFLSGFADFVSSSSTVEGIL